MQTIKNIDYCISLLRTTYFKIRVTKHRSYYSNLKQLKLAKSILEYRLLPSCTITIAPNADKEKCRAGNKHLEYFEEFWEACNNYKILTLEELENDFWLLTPDIKQINDYVDFINKKFKKAEVNFVFHTEEEIVLKMFENWGGYFEDEKAKEEFIKVYIETAELYNNRMDKVRHIFKDIRTYSPTPKKSELSEAIKKGDEISEQEQKKFTQEVAALIIFYKGLHIDDNNASQFAKDYGNWEAKNSGLKLKRFYNDIANYHNRVGGFASESATKIKNQKERIELAIKYLNENEKKQANEDLETLNNYYRVQNV